MQPVIIVTAFGRGLWLADQLNSQGIPVIVVDMTQELGSGSAEDIEGPFALFSEDQLEPSQFAFWSHGESAREIASGLTFLLNQGPLELRSRVASLRMKALGLALENLDYVATAAPDIKGKLKNRILQENWLAQFAHHWTSVVDLRPADSMTWARPLALTSSCWIRKPVPVAEALKELGQKVPVYQDRTIEDLSFKDRHTVSGLLLKKDRSEITASSQVVWALTSLETQFLSPLLSQRIFQSQVIEPHWCWLRWNFELQIPGAPQYFVWLNDPELPWSHENLVVVKKNQSIGGHSVWLKIPYQQRFNRAYLMEETQALERALKNRFPYFETGGVTMPAEVFSTYEEMGPALFGVYKEGVFDQKIQRRLDYFHGLSSEQQLALGPNATFEKESQLLATLTTWWKRQQEIQNKKQHAGGRT